MATYVALLRGINVGGHRIISMQALRALFASLGHGDVKTYVQSGNVVFRGKGSSPAQIAKSIQRKIASEFGFEDVDVFVRTPEELGAILAANPFPRAASDPTKLHVLFLADAPEPATVRAVVQESERLRPDEVRFHGREAYLHLPNGAARFKLANSFLGKKLQVAATARNWNTVRKLHEMATALDSGSAGAR